VGSRNKKVIKREKKSKQGQRLSKGGHSFTPSKKKRIEIWKMEDKGGIPEYKKGRKKPQGEDREMVVH